jgi:hypothetical protein
MFFASLNGLCNLIRQRDTIKSRIWLFKFSMPEVPHLSRLIFEIDVPKNAPRLPMSLGPWLRVAPEKRLTAAGSMTDSPYAEACQQWCYENCYRSTLAKR